MNSKKVASPQKRILFIDQYSQMGGGQVVLMQLLGICMRHNFLSRVIAPPGGDFEESIQSKDPGLVEFVAINELSLSTGKKNWRDLFKVILSFKDVLRLLRHFRWAEVVYVNGPRFALPVALLSLFVPRKFIYHIHLNHSNTEKRLIQWISFLPNTFRVILASKFIQNKMANRRVLGKKFVVQPNSLPVELYNLPFVDRWAKTQSVTAVCIGRISPEKGQSLLINVAKQIPNMNFVIIGSSDFQSEDYAKSLQAAAPKNVKFYGKTANLIATLNELQAQISIVPSKWEEPFGLVAIESMACSLLTITSGTGELFNIARQTECFEAENEVQLEATLLRILQMPESERLANARKQHDLVNKKYSPQEYEDAWLQLI